MATLSLVVRFLVVVMALPSVVVRADGQSEGEMVAVRWGVADSIAVVGKLFYLHIPSDAFSGSVQHYSVHSSDGLPLPRWMEFDEKASILRGIPTSPDAGQLFLDITAHGKNNQATVISTVYVRDVPSHASGAPLRFKSNGPQFVSCKQTEPETVATIILDVDIDALPVADRLKLLNTFVSHMNLHEGMIKMTPVAGSPLHDTSALVSGTGDCASPKTSGLFVSWPVGCGQVKEGHFPVLRKLDEDSGNGKIGKVLGHSVIGWRVTNSRFQTPTRKKRQVHVTATPSVTPIMPTKTEGTLDLTDDKMAHTIVDGESPTYIRPTATVTPEFKTDEPVVVAPHVDMDQTSKVMPTETTPVVLPVTRTTEIMPVKPTKPHEPLKPTCIKGQNPQVKNRFLKYSYHTREVIDIRIPVDMFEDCEVGNTPGLELNLFRDKEYVIPPDFFLQFDSQKQRIVGLPMSQDGGTYTFNLVGKKSASLSASAEITIVVNDSEEKKINHELSVAVDYDYNKFINSISDKVDLANKVAGVYGDSDVSSLVITRIEQGSVIYGWTNTSVTTVGCPAKEIQELTRKLVNKDGTLNERAIEKLKPFILLSAEAQPAGDCKDNPDFPTISKPKVVDNDKEVTTSEGAAKGSKEQDDDDDLWLTIVVPCIVVAVILFIALLIACILYRRKRKGKMNVEEQNTFMNKGKPIIFPNELDDKPGDVNKPLLVEGSPSAPPGYHRGASESPEPQVAGNYRNLSASSPADDEITEMPEKPYEPPPPLAANNGKQPRPPHQQQPFTQAPVILP